MGSDSVTKKVKSNVFIVSLFATIAYTLTVLFITNNTLTYSTLPRSILVEVPDANKLLADTTHNFKPFVLNVHSQLPMDTIKQKTKLPLKISEAQVLFHQNPTFLVWILLISIMVSIAAGSIPVSISQIGDLKASYGFKRPEITKAIFYAIFLVVFLMVTNNNLKGYYKPPTLINEFKVLLNHGYILEMIVVATVVLVSPTFVQIFLIGLVSGKVELEEKSIPEFDKAIKRLKYLNKSLQNAMQLLAIIVVFSVLTSTALGEAIKRTIKIDGFDVYPNEINYVYGMYFSLFLCIIYVPVYFYIKQNFLKLKDEAYDLVTTEPDKYTTWYNNQFGQTKFEGTVTDNLKLALTMLSPLLSGFLPDTFGLIK